jgi:hypothetical protein
VVVLTIELLAEELYIEQTLLVEMNVAMLHVELAEQNPMEYLLEIRRTIFFRKLAEKRQFSAELSV